MAVNELTPAYKWKCWFKEGDGPSATIEDTTPERAAEQFIEQEVYEEGDFKVMVRLLRTNLTWLIEVSAWLELNCVARKTKIVKQEPRRRPRRKK